VLTIGDAVIRAPRGLFTGKFLHVHCHDLLGVSIWNAARLEACDLLRENAIQIGAVLSILFGVSDEVHQYFVPGCAASVIDVLIDTVGALLGLGVVLLLA